MRGMFVTGPPSPGGAALRVRAAVGRTYGDLTGQVLNPTLRGYVTDLTAPYGIAVREDLIEQGAGHSYGEMCVPLLDELVPEEAPADLLVLATEIPDVRYGRATATYLSWHCAGAPLAFTVCDQGLLAAFTALHLIEAYARSGECGRAVLLVAEQPTLYHELPAPTPLPDRAAAVGVVLETGGAPGTLSVRRHTEIAEHNAPDVLAAEVSSLSADHSVLVGAGLAGSTADEPAAGQPLTGIWLELSARLSDLRESGGQLLLADYDALRRQLITATLRAD